MPDDSSPAGPSPPALLCINLFYSAIALGCAYYYYQTPDKQQDTSIPRASTTAKINALRHLAGLVRLEGEAAGDLPDHRLVGLHPLTLSSAAGTAEVVPYPKDGIAYRVTVPVVCTGTAADAGRTTRVYQVVVDMAMTDDNRYVVAGYTATKVRDAGPWELAWFWLAHTVGVCLLMMWTIFLAGLIPAYVLHSVLHGYPKIVEYISTTYFNILFRGTRGAATLNSAWLAYTCWGSLAYPTFAAAAVGGTAWLIQQLAERAHTRWKPRS